MTAYIVKRATQLGVRVSYDQAYKLGKGAAGIAFMEGDPTPLDLEILALERAFDA